MKHALQVEDILDRAAEFRASAAALAVPVLAVRAGLHSGAADEDWARFAQLVPHAAIVPVAEAGHLVARDRPADLARIIRDFPLQDAVRDRRIDLFLAQRGADTLRHPGGTLARHLHRTAETLRSWGASPALIDAGRLHAAYGTDGFVAAVVDDMARKTVEAVVGAEAETIIDLYCRCDRDRSYPTWHGGAPVLIDRNDGEERPLSPAMRTALMELTVANELDVLAHDPEIAARFGDSLFRLFATWRPFLSDGAKRAVSRSN